MTKTKAGERKRTVTVVTGPMTVGMQEQLMKAMSGTPGYIRATMTDLASIGLGMALMEWCRVWKVEPPRGWAGNRD